jgi:indolepyruvate ferredoxin oxidoreductase alpha subunit
MGDGGFWHNGLITGVASNLFNKNDGVLIVMANGYTSATGQQYMPSSATSRQGTAPGMEIERRCARSASSGCARCAPITSPTMVKTLKEAMRTPVEGLKVIIADGECQLGAPAPRARRGCREAQGRRARGAREVRR